MLPEGVTYHAGWVDTTGNRCFQLMEAPRRESLSTWVDRWSDLIDFEIVPVLASANYWADRRRSLDCEPQSPGGAPSKSDAG